MRHFISVAFLLICSTCFAQDTKIPYVESTYITSIEFHFNTIKTQAKGSDIWPVTWASDGQLYTAWGDGNGFSGPQKVSWGIARLEGPPTSWHGKDIFYGPSGSGKGKISGLLAVKNVLYAWKNTQNRKYPYCDIILIRSSDHGHSWQESGVRFGPNGFKPMSFINFGKGYSGSRDKYVYIAGFNAGAFTHDIYLARVAKKKLSDAEAYRFLSGFTATHQPLWSKDSSDAIPIFHGVAGKDYFSFPVIIYNAGLKRYLLSDTHGSAGKIGIFESREPWGPWRKVYYDNHWGGINEGEYLGFEFPNKWVSEDGHQLHMVFSVYDSDHPGWNDACNVMAVTLMTK